MPTVDVLIIEDDEDIRALLRLALDMEGYTVVEAENGQVGLDRLNNSLHPSLILMDLMMPVMDGWEFVQAVAQSTRFASIPIVAVTASGEEVGQIPHIRGCIRKPLDLEVLMKTVNLYCRKG